MRILTRRPSHPASERALLVGRCEGEAVDGGDLTAFRFKTLPTQEFLVHEQAIEENLDTSFTLVYSHFQRHNRLSALAEALAAKRLLLHTPTQDAVDLPKMVQVVCRF